MGEKRFDALDGMRGICALIVVVYHCDNTLHTGHLLAHTDGCRSMCFLSCLVS